MQWIFYEQIDEETGKVVLIYNIDPPAEVKEHGNYIKVNSVPSPGIKEGKSPVTMIDLLKKEVYYDYVDREMSTEEKSDMLMSYIIDMDYRLSLQQMGI